MVTPPPSCRATWARPPAEGGTVFAPFAIVKDHSVTVFWSPSYFLDMSGQTVRNLGDGRTVVVWSGYNERWRVLRTAKAGTERVVDSCFYNDLIMTVHGT